MNFFDKNVLNKIGGRSNAGHSSEELLKQVSASNRPQVNNPSQPVEKVPSQTPETTSLVQSSPKPQVEVQTPVKQQANNVVGQNQTNLTNDSSSENTPKPIIGVQKINPQDVLVCKYSEHRLNSRRKRRIT